MQTNTAIDSPVNPNPLAGVEPPAGAPQEPQESQAPANGEAGGGQQKDYQEWRKLSGILRTKDAEIAEQKSLVKDLSDQLNVLTDQVKQLTSTREREQFDLETSLTPEENEAYAESLPVVQKVARKVAAEQASKYETKIADLEARLADATKNVESVATAVQRMSQEDYLNAVRVQVPDMDNLVSTPDWDNFIQQPVSEFSARSISEELKEAVGKRDVALTVRILSRFQTAQADEAPTPPDHRVVPTGSQAKPESGKGGGRKSVLKFSEKTKALQDFLAKRITSEKWAEVKAMYQTAEAEGRVDFNS